jgi:hypothetical protein
MSMPESSGSLVQDIALASVGRWIRSSARNPPGLEPSRRSIPHDPAALHQTKKGDWTCFGEQAMPVIAAEVVAPAFFAISDEPVRRLADSSF